MWSYISFVVVAVYSLGWFAFQARIGFAMAAHRLCKAIQMKLEKT